MDHYQAHLNEPEGIPTQCNPFNYGGYLASPEYCTSCLGDVMLLATMRMKQYPDRLQRQAHVDEHIEKLNDI